MATKLYVGNLAHGTTADTLRTLFEGAGRRVVDVAIITDRISGEARGFAFVEMASPDDAQAAITALHGTTVDGRVLTVNEARPKADRGAGGGRGGYGRDRG